MYYIRLETQKWFESMSNEDLGDWLQDPRIKESRNHDRLYEHQMNDE